MTRRSYNDQLYAKFRYDVRKRDKRCKWPNCCKNKKLQVHHILPWKTYPLLRYQTTNGITLCLAHHKMVTGHELTYAKFLLSLI